MVSLLRMAGLQYIVLIFRVKKFNISNRHANYKTTPAEKNSDASYGLVV
jgi:hypothetical protein